MRRATNNYGWVEDGQGQFLGLALGYDFCAEHEWGAAPMYRALGVNRTKPGFDGITATQAPPVLQWEERKVRKPVPTKQRNHAKPVELDKLDEAVLYLATYARNWNTDLSTFDLAERELGKMTDMRWGYYEPKRDDIQVAWDKDEAIVHVRGRENIERLRQVYDAIQKADLAFNAPAGAGFTRRDSGMAFGIASRFDEAYRQDLLEQDLAQQRLEAAVDASGIKQLLKDNDKSYYALSPDWMDRERETGLVFFLNPARGRQGTPQPQHGWFTLDELQAWARNEGPVLADHNLEAAAKLHAAGTSLFSTLVKTAEEKLGETVHVRHLDPRWMDPDTKLRLGVNVWPAPANAEGPWLKAGLHDFQDLLANPAAYVEQRTPALTVAPDDSSSPRRARLGR